MPSSSSSKILDKPPILPDLMEELDEYLLDPGRLPMHNSPLFRYWDRTPKPERLLHIEVAPAPTTLKVERDFSTGEVIGFREISIRNQNNPSKQKTTFEITEYLSTPPGLNQGLDLTPKEGEEENRVDDDDDVLNLTNVLSTVELELWKDAEKKEEKKVSSNSELKRDEVAETPVTEDLEIEDMGVPVVINTSTSSVPPPVETAEWAEIVDVSKPVTDFHEQIPQMAYTWPFELDTFQKQAVLKLERNESVFVAAHTSAGKTVVAEYAIALSRKYETKTIYTSPIKALSNQKFRDFKDTFKDVGLITGDIQINPTASCLIMTTEILRSMLYNGSDVISDLQYVIFDEVHYINDAERGVVWEEVLILLPDYVNIVMLSATVPNTLEFADWVGRTKKKKIYVINTLKRPVPLEHYLYTGSNGKTKDDIFLILDAAGRFMNSGYSKAVEAKRAKKPSTKDNYGAKESSSSSKRLTPMQEKNVWITLVDHLSRKDKLPVVAFTLSRKRCDQNAAYLTSLDLTTSVEKSDIHHFISKCVSKLKGGDRKLPQVLQLTELLKRGIGIHHSGVLPILKEVVEMLFQKGWVKLLFATETFAMGINMPARTVVFDNITKHDGNNFRTLLPAEYIQMAGRAGRRGLDTTGTVIILCKSEVPQMDQLHGMMLGKPTRLESKFRLTYSMILNLLRVEQLRVEDMMKRSFSEMNTQKKQKIYKARLTKLKREIESLPSTSDSNLETLYEQVRRYFDIKDSIWTLILSHPAAVKVLFPGRILLLQHETIYKFGILLSVNKLKAKTYLVLVFDNPIVSDQNDDYDDDTPLLRFVNFIENVIYNPMTSGVTLSHSVLEVEDKNLMEITKKCVKISADKIINDVKRRQIARFKDDPLGPSVSQALQELSKYSNEVVERRISDPFFSPIQDFKIQDMDLLKSCHILKTLNESVKDLSTSILDSEFRSKFGQIYRFMELKSELRDMEFLLSEESLTLLPDYHNRIEVLKKLKYIDDSKTVQLKGKVACEMGNHELLCTELIFGNVLTNRPVEEIAALLSCMVFQQKHCSEPQLTESLKDGVEKIKNCARVIGTVQRECGMLQPVGDYVDGYLFGLTEVVYEWARGMPFAEITQLTDVQEGVIVRTIQRLDEILRNIKDAARVVGEPVFYQKMDEASNVIKRDIVFAASLYTQ